MHPKGSIILSACTFKGRNREKAENGNFGGSRIPEELWTLTLTEPLLNSPLCNYALLQNIFKWDPYRIGKDVAYLGYFWLMSLWSLNSPVDSTLVYWCSQWKQEWPVLDLKVRELLKREYRLDFSLVCVLFLWSVEMQSVRLRIAAANKSWHVSTAYEELRLL